MHGLVHSAPWQVARHTSEEISLEICIGPATGRHWLGLGRVRQRFSLDEEGLTIELAITAVEGSWPAALGFHPWFRQRLDGVGGEAEYSYRPKVRLVVTGDDWPRLPTTDLGPYPHDDLFAELAAAPEIRWPNGLGLRLESDAPVWVVYERHAHGFCIEPWTDTDGPLSLHNEPALHEGETRSLSLRMAVTRN